MCPLKIVDVLLVTAISVGVWTTYVMFFKSPYAIKECPIMHGQKHVRSEYRTDGSVICSYQEITPVKVILRRQA
jgi:hypothetical protein